MIIADSKIKEVALDFAKKHNLWVIESSGVYYMEDEPPMVRAWEKLVYSPEHCGKGD